MAHDFDEMNNRAKRLLTAPGTTMLHYLGAYESAGRPFDPHQIKPDESPLDRLHTSMPGAMKKALQLLGIRSEQNHEGLPVDFDVARELFFSGEEVDETREAEFRSTIETGDPLLDRKRVKQFVNHDGSTTYEVLNTDKKTIASKFTLGTFEGKMVFAQGGYDAYAKELRKLSSSTQTGPMTEFEGIRQMMSKR